jgi:hypothetical protein
MCQAGYEIQGGRSLAAPRVENDYREFIGLLNANRVDYLVIGAYSAIFHTGAPQSGIQNNCIL